jgi:hypothetical protein
MARRAPAAGRKEVDAWLAERHPEAARLAVWAREALLDAEPDLEMRILRGWGAVAFHHPDAGYVAGLFPRGADLTMVVERGASLDDPDGVLTGAGTRTRNLPIRRADARTEAVVRDVLARAIAFGLTR